MMLNEPSHFSKLTDEFELVLFEKSAWLTACENLEIISHFISHSKGYSVQATSVILKYHIRFFLLSNI